MLKNMKVWQKLTLISLSFSLPLAVLLSLLIRGINADIHFARLERSGNAYQRPLELLLEYLPQHQRLAQQAPQGAPPLREALSKSQARIDQAFEALTTIDQQLGTALQFTAEGLGKRGREHLRVSTVQAEWHDLKASLERLSSQASAERHRHLMTDVRTMITHAGDTSNLILDPDLDSYYLMDITLLALPQTQERLATIIAYGADVLQRQALTDETRLQFAVYAVQLQEADFDRIVASTQTALNEDANFYRQSSSLQSRLPAAIQAYTAATEAFIKVLQRLVNPATTDVTPETYIAAGEKARDASVALWNVAVTELDVLLQNRIDHYTRSRAMALLLTALAVAASVVLVLLIIRSITRPLHQVLGVAQDIAAGKLTVWECHSRDEIGLLAASFRRVTETLRGLTDETTRVIRAAQEQHLDVRGDTTGFHGIYGDLVGSVNQVMDTMAMLTQQVKEQRDAAVTFLQEAALVLEQVAERDLRVRMDGEYADDYATIKIALNQAVENLDTGLKQVATGAGRVATTVGEITAGSQTLAQGASEQASTLQEISSSLREMAAASRQNAANAQEARSVTESTRQSADAGTTSMRRLSQAIDAIKATSDETAKIVKTIDEIAFQTNLLALNAAVEAARAGDAGKGFAVVAEEVRNLAMRSAEAAKKTAQLIQEAVQKAGDGVTLNQEVLTNLDEIVTQVHRVSEVMHEITTASEQQQQGIEQLNIAVEQLNQVTQQTAANSEEAASAAEELSGQAAEMQHIVTTFQLSAGHGHTAAPGKVPARATRTPAPPQKRPAAAVPLKALATAGHPTKNGRGELRPEDTIPFDDDDNAFQEF